MTNENIVARAAGTPREHAAEPLRSPSLPLDGFPAEHSGTCPCCGKFIRAGVSMIASLDVPLPPSPEHVYRLRGTWLSRSTGKTTNTRPRVWCHAACRARAGDAEEQAILAAERREELRRVRREADELEGFGGTRRGRR